MRRKDAVLAGELIQRFLRQQSLEAPLNEQRLMSAWPEVLGTAIEKYTGDMYIRNQTLFVHLRSAAVRQELVMRRQSLIQQLNAKAGATVITNIIFQ